MAVASLLLTALWIAYLLRAARYGAEIRQLKDEAVWLRPKKDPATTPRLSIVIAARDERHTMSESLPKLLALNYPNLEFILIDDRSTDGTGELLDDLASADRRVRVLHIDELPPNWLGKVHALYSGEKIATGDWLLFTDADIHFAPHALTLAVEYAEQNALDLLCLIPESHETRGTIANAFEAAFGTLFVQTAWAPNLLDPKKPDAIGVGAFNLVRRSTFDRTPGFEWLRMEVLDDIGVGRLLKEHGGREALLFGYDLVSFEWYRNAREMVKGLEKNLFGGFGRYSYSRMSFILLGLLILAAGPIVLGVLSGNLVALSIVVLGQILLPAVIAATAAERFSIKPLVMAALPIGMLFIVYAGVRSMYRAWKQQGIRWRETLYPLDTLRRMQRVKL